MTTGTFTVKRGLADMLRGGVVMDVVNAEQAKVAEDAGAVAVRALERVPPATRRDGGGGGEDAGAPVGLGREIGSSGKRQVPLFCAGGIATPSDAAVVMQLGAEAVFVGSGIFKSSDPARMASAIVEATAHFTDAEHVAKVSRGLGEAMRGLEAAQYGEHLADRGW